MFAVFCLLVALAEEHAAKCSDAKQCAAAEAASEDSSLGLLQQKVGRAREDHARALQADKQGRTREAAGAAEASPAEPFAVDEAVGAVAGAALENATGEIAKPGPGAADAAGDIAGTVLNNLTGEVVGRMPDAAEAFSGAAAAIFSNITSEVWAQIAAAIEISDLEKAIQNALKNQTVDCMVQQLEQLKAAFPAYQEVQKQFAEVWGQLDLALRIDHLEAHLRYAAAHPNETLQVTIRELEEQYHRLKAQLYGVDVASIQRQAAATWIRLQRQGVPLPDLEEAANATQHAMDVAGDAAGAAIDAVTEAAVQAKAQARKTADRIADAWNNWWG